MRRAGKKADPGALAASLGLIGARIKAPETGCENDVHFASDTTADVGLNNYVYPPKKRLSDVANLHSHRKHGEMSCRLTAIEALCVSDAAS